MNIEQRFDQIGKGPGSLLGKISAEQNIEEGRLITPEKEVNAIEVSETNANSGLSNLPKDQQVKLNALSQELVDMTSTGISSVIDQNVMGMLQKLTSPKQDKFWKLILTRNGWKAMQAENTELAARARLRASVAQTAEDIAGLAEEDMERKVFTLFVNNLKTSLGGRVEIFCQEYGIPVPQEGTQAETNLILQIHGAIIGQARYKEALQKKMILFVQEKAEMEGNTALSNQRAKLLTPFIEARAKQYPLEEKATGQKAAHIASTGTTAVVSFVVGGLVGVGGGVIIGTEYARGLIGAKLEEAKAYIDDKLEEAKEKIAARRASKHK